MIIFILKTKNIKSVAWLNIGKTSPFFKLSFVKDAKSKKNEIYSLSI